MLPCSKKAKLTIIQRWYEYYGQSKALSNADKLRLAKMKIDHVSGPVPSMTTSVTVDYSKQRITGGGTIRPTLADIEALEQSKVDVKNQWCKVFDDVLTKYHDEPKKIELIQYIFKHRMTPEEICERMGWLSERTYWVSRKDIVETAFAVALQAGLLEY